MADGDLHDAAEVARTQLQALAEKVGEWAGIPLKMEGGPELVIEPTYPFAPIFAGPAAAPAADDDGWTLRSSFWSAWWRCEIVTLEKDGRVVCGKLPRAHSLDQQMATLLASAAWGVEQEARAMQLLSSMVEPHHFRSYFLTGAFIERSRRSGVIYMFRKLRPTVAIREGGGGVKALPDAAHPIPRRDLRILATLCMHPIGYYADSWAGAMCPTDDVIAHLALMRADEPMLWRRANQHPAFMPNAGI